ncbi:hypothetical protein ACV822_002474 [Klebsiella aerogenes]|uniref:hypothetical protein n=1 Tax=Klebsiella TaxID=570 RepID=UPI001BCE8345|nr:hypothetical protein [Klebsiella aerogenes]EKZ9669787.1 hypothetical protein [Klebsiella aerogenes]MDA3991811.1 hypothetical protein [Klebsiella aerogenes]MDQ8579807.1 hypothetical protein [Klebsiella aerogenes]HCR0140614.1 hypothetical protein [Klebsiella aerogenes]HDS6595706.1 hypothetical protein [Klebsiella aerogenes]
MYQSMMFQMISLGIAMNADPLVDLRSVWKKMTLLEGIETPLNFQQRAIVTRGRIAMLDGEGRFFAFLRTVCQSLPEAPWRQEVSELLGKVDLPVFMEDRAFVARFLKDRSLS